MLPNHAISAAPRARLVALVAAVALAFALCGISIPAMAASDSESSTASASSTASSSSSSSGSAAASSAAASSASEGESSSATATADGTQDAAAAAATAGQGEGALALGYDLFLAGDEVEYPGTEVFANLFAAGRSVNLSQAAVGADLFAAGETVNVSDTATDDNLFLAGNNITVSGTTGQGLYAAGNNLDISADVDTASIHGNTVFLKGTFDGDVDVDAQTVVLDPYLVVNGHLSVQAESEPTVAATARIASYEFTPAESGGILSSFGDFSQVGSEQWLHDLLFTLITTLIVGIAALLVLRPGAVDASGRLTRNRPVAVLVSGLISLVLVPAAVVGLAVSGVAWPLAAALAAIAVGAAVLAVAYTAIALSRALLGGVNRWVSSPIFLLVFALLLSLPIVDFVVIVLSVIFAFGSAVQGWWVWRRGKELDAPEPDDDDDFNLPRGAHGAGAERATAGESGPPAAEGAAPARPLTPSSIPSTQQGPANTTTSWSMPPQK